MAQTKDEDHITVEAVKRLAEQLKEDDEDRDRLRLYLMKRLWWIERIRRRMKERKERKIGKMDKIKNIVWQIRYALHAPDFKTALDIIWLALHGCTGADNVDEVRARLERNKMSKPL